MYETLITLYNSELYKGKQIAADMKLPEPKFREIWDASDDDRTLGTRSFEDVITEILPRKNLLIRPPLANLDQLLFVLSGFVAAASWERSGTPGWRFDVVFLWPI